MAARAHRNLGKDKVLEEAPPPELPEDLPLGVKYNMSWRSPKDGRIVLLEITDQGNRGTCWSISFNNMISAHLLIHEKVDSLLKFSKKHLYANIDEKLSTGYLKKYDGLSKFLVEEGLVLEKDCKCEMERNGTTTTTACDKIEGRNFFLISELVIVEKNIDETVIIDLLKKKGPIVVEFPLTEKYKCSTTDEIYFGPKGITKGTDKHLSLLTGIGTKNGVHYFEYQNSYGLKWGGDKGFGKFARKISLPKGQKSLIVAYMYPKLLDGDPVVRR